MLDIPTGHGRILPLLYVNALGYSLWECIPVAAVPELEEGEAL